MEILAFQMLIKSHCIDYRKRTRLARVRPKNSILDDHQSLTLQLNKLSSGLAMIITKQPTEPLAACDTTVDRPAFVAGFSYLVAKTLVVPFTVVVLQVLSKCVA